MAVIDVALEVIDDNPYNPRKHYPQAKVGEMAQSLREVGLRQIPEGRHVDGRVQIAYGHMRKRGYLSNQKKDPEHWKMMPIDVKEISDEDMFHFSMEENLTRTDITPLEVARCIENFSLLFPEVLDETIAKKHHMTPANVSNMKRVLRLPGKILEKIDSGIISFTQGRELLTLGELENAENLMSSALSGLRTGNKSYGHANTVEGLQASIHEIISRHYRPLDKEWAGYSWSLLFDTRGAGCLDCAKMIRTHPNKSGAAHYCMDGDCWDRHDKEHRDQAAAAAKAKMQANILERVVKDVAQRTPEPDLPPYNLKKRGTSWIALDAQGVVIAIAPAKKEAEDRAIKSFESVTTVIDPKASEYVLNHTYRISRKWDLRKPDDIFDVTAQDLATAITALGVKMEDIEAVRVFKSSGKLGTAGDVSAGWSKCTEPLDNISQEMSVQWDCGQCKVFFEFSPPGDNSPALVQCPSCGYEYVTYRRKDGVLFCLPKHSYKEPPEVKIVSTLPSDGGEKATESKREPAPVAIDEGGGAIPVPCTSCAKADTCDRSYFHIAADSDELVCEQKVEAAPEDLSKLSQRIAETPAPEEIPEDLLAQAKAAAGTRAEVLDLRPLTTDDWRHELKGGFVNLSNCINEMDDPGECLERCTRGFHYAFDSKFIDRAPGAVCTDPKCAAQKKSALTRKRNAAGQARKKAEVKAIKEAIAQTTTLDRSRIKLILLAQMDGRHCTRHYYDDGKKPETWLWDKVSPGTPNNERKPKDLFKRLDKLSDEEMAKLVVEFMFFYLTDKGDLGTYEIKASEPLKWMGIDIVESDGAKDQ